METSKKEGSGLDALFFRIGRESPLQLDVHPKNRELRMHGAKILRERVLGSSNRAVTILVRDLADILVELGGFSWEEDAEKFITHLYGQQVPCGEMYGEQWYLSFEKSRVMRKKACKITRGVYTN